MTTTTFSRLAHLAFGFWGTAAALLLRQHTMDGQALRTLSVRCILIAVIAGILWEHVVQEIIAILKPHWKWSRRADNGAALAFPAGAGLAALAWWVVR